MGCGDGVLGGLSLGSGLRRIGIDLSLTLLSQAPRPAMLAAAACLPFSSHGVDPSVAATQADQPSFPLTITKRGALLFGRKS